MFFACRNSMNLFLYKMKTISFGNRDLDLKYCMIFESSLSVYTSPYNTLTSVFIMYFFFF